MIKKVHVRFIPFCGGFQAAMSVSYVKNLFQELRPYKNRFIFSASCNTPINAPWESMKHFRNAWIECREV